MKHRILISTQLSTKTPSPQSLLIHQMLACEGYPVIIIGRGETGLKRLLDVALRGFYQTFRNDVVLVDVYGHRAFLYESLSILYAKLLGRRVVAMLRGGWMYDFIKARPRLARWVLRKPDLLLTPSNFLAVQLQDLGLKIDRIIPNIIRLEAYHYRERERLEPRFLYMRGTYPQIYNPEMSLRAFSIIQDRYPQASISFATSGSIKACEALVRKLNLRNVSFLGYVPKDRIPELADQHDIYLSSNRIENMPISILEMWAIGVPVVGTDAGGTPYLVRHGQDGLLVPSEDYQALAEACCRLLEDPALALRLARHGHARIQEFTWENIRDQWHDALGLDHPNGQSRS